MTRKLFPDEEAAIMRFAAAHGRCWKNHLASIYWYNARLWQGPGSEPNDGGILHGLRNDPNWNTVGLRNYKLPRAKRAPLEISNETGLTASALAAFLQTAHPNARVILTSGPFRTARKAELEAIGPDLNPTVELS
jgi:hypothetical protein